MSIKLNKTKGVFEIQNPEWQTQMQGIALASFRARASAFLIDGVIIFLIRALFGISTTDVDSTGEIALSLTLKLDAFVSAVVAIVYFSLVMYWGNGATIGKRVMGIRVVSLTHDHLTLWHCIERALGYAASWLEAGFGFLQYFTHPNNQTVHDRIAETIVIKGKQEHPIAMQQTHHPIRCQCGMVQGHVISSAAITRGLCYCKDCQAFAHFLGKSTEVLNEQGGTDIVPTSTSSVVITKGNDSLACMRLSKKGLLRWYAKCCNTPIGNTSTSSKVAYVGLIHSCLDHGSTSLDQSFGSVRMLVHPKSAKGQVSAKSSGTFVALMKLLSMLLRERLSGNYKRSPFFVAATGKPIATPIILTDDERQALRSTQ